MTKKQITKMLASIFERADYDLYKSHFVKDCIEDFEENEEFINDLVEIVDKYVNK